MRIAKRLAVTLVVGAALLATPALAETVQVTFTSSGFGSNFNFTTDSAPTPAASDGGSFRLNIAQFNYGSITLAEPITFLASNSGGGLSDAFGGGIGFFTWYGPQLFSGTTAAPTLLTGSFNLVDYAGAPAGTLTINALSTGGGVPEPAAWTMLILGFGGVGWAMRRGARPQAAI